MKTRLLPAYLFMLAFLFVLSSSTQADVITKTYNFKDFHMVDISSGMHFNVTQSDNYSIEVKVHEEDEKYLLVRKRGEKLEISFRKSGWFNFRRHKTVEINITMPELTNLGLSGGSITNIKMDISSKSFSADLSGGTILKGNLNCGDIHFDLSGGSQVELTGKGNNLSVDGSGGSMIKFKKFFVKNVDAELSGGYQVTINMNGTLNTDQSGGSQIIYYGNATIGHTDFSGGSGVSKGE